MIKRIAERMLCFIISAIILLINLSYLCVYAGDDLLEWGYVLSTEMQFAPEDKYMCKQNSPDFLWPYRGDNIYDLVICSDENLTDVLYEKSGLTDNFYTFDHTLEAGETMYWSVRFYKNGNASQWSQARRFKISSDAYEFTLPSLEVLKSRIPETHPRIFTNQSNLSEVREYKSISKTSKEVYDYYYKRAKAYVEAGELPKEPLYDSSVTDAEWAAALMKLRTDADKLLNIIMECGFIYLISGDEEIGEFAVDALVELCSWDPKGATGYATQDQVHRQVTFWAAMGYDWCYDLLSNSDKEIVQSMINSRMEDMLYLMESIKKSPYDSHGWTTLGMMCITSLAMYKDMPEAAEWFSKCVPMYATICPPWDYEDGGWANGTTYWQYSKDSEGEYTFISYLAGLYNLGEKARLQNEIYFYLYAWPYGEYSIFGDDNLRGKLLQMYSSLAQGNAALSNNKYAKWFAEEGGAYPARIRTYFIGPQYEMVESGNILELQPSREFESIGWACMHSDIKDENRISLYFKSSPYGSWNHSHADQNCFMITAFGEKLAVNGGYYDYYHSDHDLEFTRQTYAHNGITFNGGQGQDIDNKAANGELTHFLTTSSFDMCKGEASRAYSDKLERADRTIIYIRPDQYIVIDDLAMKDKSISTSFEWWLNAENTISVYDTGAGAKIEQGNAVLDVSVKYPEGCNSYYTNLHSGPDLVNHAASGTYANANVQKRVWFETPKANNTKIVATMDVHTKDFQAKYVAKEQINDLLKLTFEDGTAALINLSNDNNKLITYKNVSFRGTAAVYNDDACMLADGTYLEINGKKIAESDKNISYCAGRNEISVSANDDTVLTIDKDNDYISNIESITAYDGKELIKESGAVLEGNKLILEKGDYSFIINQKKKGGEYAFDVPVSVTLNGEAKEFNIPAYYRQNNELTISGKIEIPAGRYNISNKSPHLNFGGFENNSVAKVSGEVYVSTSLTSGNHITLEPSKTINAASAQLADCDSVKNSAEIFIEAEDSKLLIGGNVYTTRAFLSGGCGVSKLDELDDKAVYTVNVKKEGNYDIFVKYVSWDQGVTPIRLATIGGNTYSFELPFTAGWGSTPEEWRVVKIDAKVHLDKGENTLILEAVSGSWNYDWIVFNESN